MRRSDQRGAGKRLVCETPRIRPKYNNAEAESDRRSKNYERGHKREVLDAKILTLLVWPRNAN